MSKPTGGCCGKTAGGALTPPAADRRAARFGPSGPDIFDQWGAAEELVIGKPPGRRSLYWTTTYSQRVIEPVIIARRTILRAVLARRGKERRDAED